MLLDRSSLAIQAQLADSIASPSSLAVRREQAVLLADALARLPRTIARSSSCVIWSMSRRRDRRANGPIAQCGAQALGPGHGGAQTSDGGIRHEPEPLFFAPSRSAMRSEDSEVVRILDAYLSRHRGRPAGRPREAARRAPRARRANCGPT